MGVEELSAAHARRGGAGRAGVRAYVGPAAVRSVRDHFADALLMSVTDGDGLEAMTEILAEGVSPEGLARLRSAAAAR